MKIVSTLIDFGETQVRNLNFSKSECSTVYMKPVRFAETDESDPHLNEVMPLSQVIKDTIKL